MRNVSSAVRRAVYAQESDQVFVPLVKIDHADMAQPLYIVGDTKEIERDSIVYAPAPFSYELPDDEDGKLQSVKIRIENVSRVLIEIIRSIQDAPDVTFEIVRAADPTDVVAGPFELRLDGVSYNAITIEGELGRRARLDVEFPRSDYAYIPPNYPGLF